MRMLVKEALVTALWLLSQVTRELPTLSDIARCTLNCSLVRISLEKVATACLLP